MIGAVFDEVSCTCNSVYDVYEPCGTKPDDGNKPDNARCPIVLDDNTAGSGDTGSGILIDA